MESKNIGDPQGIKPYHASVRGPASATNVDALEAQNSFMTATPEATLSDKTTNNATLENSDNLSKTEGNTTVKDVSKFFKAAGLFAARGLAGVAGGALMAGTGLGGATLIAVVALPAFILTVPTALLGAIIGGAIGAKDNSNVSRALKEDFGEHGAGVIVGALGGAALPVMAYILAESAASIPKTAIVATVGFLGTGLLAFAITGKREKDENVPADKDTTNEKLQKALILSSVPIWRVLKIGEQHKKHIKDFLP